MHPKAKALLLPLKALRDDYFFLALCALLVVLTVPAPAALSRYPALVDWHTVATLAGLMMLTKGVEMSGYLHRLGEHLILAMPTQRALALLLVLATALLAMLLTNDVALFVMVPLTLSLRTVATLPVTRLVIFEALAANAGATLTPIGNPQNLFLWQLSHVSFHVFVARMLPLTAILMVPLLALAACAFSGRELRLEKPAELPAGHRRLLFLSLGLYLPFLILADLHHARVAAVVVAGVFLLADRKVLTRVDWALILIFMLMFIDLRLIARMDAVRSLMESAGLAQPQRLYLAGMTISQVISNMPAAILLAEYTKDWRLIACSVNVGGFGLMLESLANIIALRMARDRRAWLTFHAYSLPFLLAAGGLVYCWLFGFPLSA